MSTIAVIGPSNMLTLKPDELERAKAALMGMGYHDILFPPSHTLKMEAKKPLKHLTVQERLNDLHWAFSEPGVGLVLTLTGGASANELLPHINWDIIESSMATLCGYSDIGTLCNAILAKTGRVALYGNNLINFAEIEGNDFNINYHVKAVGFSRFAVGIPEGYINSTWDGDGPGSWTLTKHPGMHTVAGKGLSCQGRIVGGNAFALTNLLASGYAPSLQDTVVFLETSKNFSREDFFAMLNALMLREDFAGVRGVVIGTSQRGSESAAMVSADFLRAKFTQLNRDIAIPVVVGAPFGHTCPRITLPIGGTAFLDTTGGVPLLDLCPARYE